MININHTKGNNTMKKLLVMVSALSAAVFSTAKADIADPTGSYGFHLIAGGNVVDGDGAATSGTLLMNGGGLSFSMLVITNPFV